MLTKPTLTFSKVKDSRPRAHVSQIGKANLKMGAVTYEWLIFRRGTKGRVAIDKKGKFKPQIKKWPRTKNGTLKKFDVNCGYVELSYDVGHGKRREVIELIDRGPKTVRGKKIARYALIIATYSGAKRLTRTTKSIGNYRDVGAFVNAEMVSLKKTLSRKPSYHIVKPQHFSMAVPMPKAQVSQFGQGYNTISDVKKEIKSQFNDMTAEFSLLQSALADHKATRKPTVLSQFKYLPKYYIRKSKTMEIGGYPVELRSFTKRTERAPTKMAEHILYKLLRWKTTWKHSGRTRSRWNEVGWLLLRWGYGRGYGRTVPTYTVVDPKGKEHDFRVPMTAKESEKLMKERTRLRGVHFTRRPSQAARKYIENDIKNWKGIILKSQKKKDPDYFKKGRKTTTDTYGNMRVVTSSYGFLKRPIGKTKNGSIIGGLTIEVYKKGSRKLDRPRRHWQLVKETGKVMNFRVGSKRFKMKRNATDYMISASDKVHSEIRKKSRS